MRVEFEKVVRKSRSGKGRTYHVFTLHKIRITPVESPPSFSLVFFSSFFFFLLYSATRFAPFGHISLLSDMLHRLPYLFHYRCEIAISFSIFTSFRKRTNRMIVYRRSSGSTANPILGLTCMFLVSFSKFV